MKHSNSESITYLIKGNIKAATAITKNTFIFTDVKINSTQFSHLSLYRSYKR